MVEHSGCLSAEERAVLEVFMAEHLPRTSPLFEKPKLLVVNQNDLPLPKVMQWIHGHAPAIVSMSTAEVMFNKMEGRTQRIGNDKILQIALEVVSRLLTEKDRYSFRVGHNIVLILRGEYMDISQEVLKLADGHCSKCEVYVHNEWK